MRLNSMPVKLLTVSAATLVLFFLCFMFASTSQSTDDILSGYSTTLGINSSSAVFKQYFTNIQSQAQTAEKHLKEISAELDSALDGIFTPPADENLIYPTYPPGLPRSAKGYVSGKPYSEEANVNHLGVDLAPRPGIISDVPVIAAMSGKYTSQAGNIDLGNNVTITKDITPGIVGPYIEIVLRYFHLKDGSLYTTDKEDISAGTQVGIMGNTGNSFGTHLHLELWVKEQNGGWRIYNAYTAIYEKIPLSQLPYLYSDNADAFKVRTGRYTRKPGTAVSGTGDGSV